jgi:dipeptidyl aminopeptidase/acylaminoacyl peptidase
MVEGMRLQAYPGSDLVVEQELESGSNYSRRIVSYRSEGLKIYALLTVPFGQSPPAGWPGIVFNHGYIPPDEYRTTERYIAYVDWLARCGYALLRPDYRGHGDSEGQALGGYGRPDYTIDVLNAFSSLKRFPGVNPERIGMWGHSMGGHITLRAMVTVPDLKAGVIWAGVVASYPDLISRWRATPPASISSGARRWRQQFNDQYGTPDQNPDFWAAISPDTYLTDLSGPLQLHHAQGDETVPVLFSELLYEKSLALGAPVELYIYPGDNHNINQNFAQAMDRTIAFFDAYLKE